MTDELLTLTPEQQAGATHIYEWGETFIYGPMGSGKTAVALTAAYELLRDGVVNRVMVVTTPNIARTVWPNEAVKWAHLQDCPKPVNAGESLANAKRLNIISDPANRIVVVPFTIMKWLTKHVPGSVLTTFDMLIVDESTKVASGGVAMKSLRKILPLFKVRVAMSGTPVEENFTQLFYQIMLVDNGRAFGRNRDKWLSAYFVPTDYNEYRYELNPVSPAVRQEFFNLFKRYIVRLPALSWGGVVDIQTIDVLPTDAQFRAFSKYKKDSILDTEDAAANAAVHVGKMQQIANGFLYCQKETDEPDPHHMGFKILRWTDYIYCDKPTCLASLLKSRVNKEPVVIAYQYAEQKTAIIDVLARTKYVVVDALDKGAIELFQNGLADILLLHPKSGAHGLDLSIASRLIMYSPIWSRDQTQQLIARLARKGQQAAKVNVHVLVCGEIEQEIWQRQNDKARYADVLLSVLFPNQHQTARSP